MILLSIGYWAFAAVVDLFLLGVAIGCAYWAIRETARWARRRSGRSPLPRRQPGASLCWERHVADALTVAREANATDFAEWEAEIREAAA